MKDPTPAQVHLLGIIEFIQKSFVAAATPEACESDTFSHMFVFGLASELKKQPNYKHCKLHSVNHRPTGSSAFLTAAYICNEDDGDRYTEVIHCMVMSHSMYVATYRTGDVLATGVNVPPDIVSLVINQGSKQSFLVRAMVGAAIPPHASCIALVDAEGVTSVHQLHGHTLPNFRKRLVTADWTKEVSEVASKVAINNHTDESTKS